MVGFLKRWWHSLTDPLRVVLAHDPLDEGAELVHEEDGWHEINGRAYHAPFPHCDSNVLHSPGTCEYCDKYPRAQAERIRNWIAFTDDHQDVIDVWNLTPCPSTKHRSVAQIEQWPGNRAKVPDGK